ncbi:hypothetical protein BVRB_5g104850 [Beta vulgaris subsp. vulgaris]|nr:hypothetical protein BVRB_5g104850 [Beta vulgaris subsp. vulgaris]
MVYFKEFKHGDDIHLSLIDNEEDDLRTGITFVIHKSLLRPDGMHTHINKGSLLSEMSVKVSKGSHDVTPMYVLKSTVRDNFELPTSSSMLGRRIISGSVRWGSKSLRISGEAVYLPGYWEWTEDVLSRFGSILDSCSIYPAVQASLFLYDKNPDIIRSFCESWCPTSNTLHTMTGEWSISLWDLYKFGGLPIVGKIYDETVPSYNIMRARDKEGRRLLSQACEILFVVYHTLTKDAHSRKGVSTQSWIDFWCKQKRVHKEPTKRRRYSESRPKFTANPSVNIETQPIVWEKAESDMFNLLGLKGVNRRTNTYVAAFISCWLCTFVLPDSEERLIRPSTFEIVVLMACGHTFSLAIPVLSSIYRGLNAIASAPKPAYSKTFFPAHYLYGWGIN